ncbi:TRAP transporter permease [Chloroflexota bacterium]
MLYLSGSLDRLAVALHWKWLVIHPEAWNALHLGSIATIVFLLYSATKHSASNKLPWYDLLLIMVGLGSNLYFVFFYDEVMDRFVIGTSSIPDVILGLVVILVMVEAARRTTGIWMPLLALIFFIYPLFGHFLPGFLFTRPHSLATVVRHAGPSPNGMYGSMTHVSAVICVAFLFFGQVLQAARGNQFFTNMATGLFGRLSGGPALAAVGASAAFGSIAPSSAANAATTGVITIPLMKSIGITPRFAGAVEAVASNGGHILPPVMGATAFLMADFLGVTYWEIVIAAFVPGILYYTAIFIAVYLEARRVGVRGLPRRELPSIAKALASGWQFILPVMVLVWFLAYMRYSPQMSAVYATLTLLAVSMLRKDTRLDWHKLVDALAGTGRTIILVAPLFALAGVMVACLDFTGLTLRLSGGLVDLCGGSVLSLLILTAVVAIVMGMPLSSTAAYILLAILVAPALLILGVNPIATHLFLFWFAMTGPITPPTCAVCFITAAIAGEGTHGFSVGWTAMRLAAIAYILPFTFIYNPALLMMSGPVEIALAIVTAVIGVTLLAAGMQGWFLHKMNLLIRAILLAAGFMFIWPGLMTDGIGLVIAVPAVAYQLLQIRRQRQIPEL